MKNRYKYKRERHNKIDQAIEILIAAAEGTKGNTMSNTPVTVSIAFEIITHHFSGNSVRRKNKR